jgi:hypothetical protein
MAGEGGDFLVDYRQSDGVDARVENVEQRDGDTIITVATRRTFEYKDLPYRLGGVSYKIEVNASKGYLPVALRRYEIHENKSTGESSRLLREEDAAVEGIDAQEEGRLAAVNTERMKEASATARAEAAVAATAGESEARTGLALWIAAGVAVLAGLVVGVLLVRRSSRRAGVILLAVVLSGWGSTRQCVATTLADGSVSTPRSHSILEELIRAHREPATMQLTLSHPNQVGPPTRRVVMFKQPQLVRDRYFMQEGGQEVLESDTFGSSERMVFHRPRRAQATITRPLPGLIYGYDVFPLFVRRVAEKSALVEVREDEDFYEVQWANPAGTEWERTIRARFAKDPPYDVISVVLGRTGDEPELSYLFLNYRNIGAGYRFPDTITMVCSVPGKERTITDKALSIVLDTDIPDAQFVPDLPGNTAIIDQIIGHRYRADVGIPTDVDAVVRGAAEAVDGAETSDNGVDGASVQTTPSAPADIATDERSHREGILGRMEAVWRAVGIAGALAVVVGIAVLAWRRRPHA